MLTTARITGARRRDSLEENSCAGKLLAFADPHYIAMAFIPPVAETREAVR